MPDPILLYLGLVILAAVLTTAMIIMWLRWYRELIDYLERRY